MVLECLIAVTITYQKLLVLTIDYICGNYGYCVLIVSEILATNGVMV